VEHEPVRTTLALDLAFDLDLDLAFDLDLDLGF
jgi:hypothetical protein